MQLRSPDTQNTAGYPTSVIALGVIATVSDIFYAAKTRSESKKCKNMLGPVVMYYRW